MHLQSPTVFSSQTIEKLKMDDVQLFMTYQYIWGNYIKKKFNQSLTWCRSLTLFLYFLLSSLLSSLWCELLLLQSSSKKQSQCHTRAGTCTATPSAFMYYSFLVFRSSSTIFSFLFFNYLFRIWSDWKKKSPWKGSSLFSGPPGLKASMGIKHWTTSEEVFSNINLWKKKKKSSKRRSSSPLLLLLFLVQLSSFSSSSSSLGPRAAKADRLPWRLFTSQSIRPSSGTARG